MFVLVVVLKVVYFGLCFPLKITMLDWNKVCLLHLCVVGFVMSSVDGKSRIT